jgi:hypothetical protein
LSIYAFTSSYKITAQKVLSSDFGKKDFSLLRQVTKFGNTQKGIYIPSGSIVDLMVGNKYQTDLPIKKKLVSKALLFPAENIDMLSNKTENILPFNIYSSSVGSGYLYGLGGWGVTNLHRDYYGNDLVPPMQGPFSEENIGGFQYRHVPVTASMMDVAQRPEGFKIYIFSNGIRIQGPDTEALTVSNTNRPRATFHREEFAKRPIVFRNIFNKNFFHRYETIQTCGRRNLNKNLIMSGGVGFQSASAAPPFFLALTSSTYPLTHVVDYAAVQHVRHQSVFVNRFSAPGGPETNGDSNGGFGLDPLAGEYSVNNCLYMRNYVVRKANNILLGRHSGQFGVDSLLASVSSSTYVATASYYKTNRNPKYRPCYRYSDTDATIVGKSTYRKQIFNTECITTVIPQNDSAYLWITSSCNSASFGRASGSFDFQFASASANGINLGGWASSSLTNLHDILCNRGGCGGWPTWKQIRTGQRRDARYLRENNLISILEPPKETVLIYSGSF